MTRTALLLLCALALACAPTVDEEGFTLDLDAAIAARAHDLGCFAGADEAAFTLRLAITGEGDDEERTAVVIREGPENFVRGTWSVLNDLAGPRRLIVDVPDADLSVETAELEMKYGVLARFPAGDAECRVRGFFAAEPLPAVGVFRCPDEFFDRVDYALAAEGALIVEEERDDDGQITAQSDFGAYYLDGDTVYLLRPEREEPAKRFLEGTLGDDTLTLAGAACPLVAE